MNTHSLRRAAIASAIVIAGLVATTSSASAASISDGTSNTVMFGEVAAPHAYWTFSDVLVESLKGAPIGPPASS